MTIALQTYSLRSGTEAWQLETAKSLGLPVEVHWSPGFMRINPMMTQGAVAWGVPHVSGTYEVDRHTLEAAMGIPLINIDLAPGALAVAERVASDLGITLAVHNHGPGSTYPDWRSLTGLPGGGSVGACLDVGHSIRAGGVEIVQGIRVLGARLKSVHLKDVDRNGYDVPIGQGIVDIPGVIRALIEIGFAGPVAIEWEGQGSEESPLPGIIESMGYLKNV